MNEGKKESAPIRFRIATPEEVEAEEIKRLEDGFIRVFGLPEEFKPSLANQDKVLDAKADRSHEKDGYILVSVEYESGKVEVKRYTFTNKKGVWSDEPKIPTPTPPAQ